MSDRVIAFYTGEKGEPRIKIVAEGIDDLSAPIGDPMSFLTVAANQLGLEVDDSTLPDSIVVSVPAGA